jgi:hypothetical protein
MLGGPAVSLGLSVGLDSTRYYSLNANDNQGCIKLGRVRHTNFDNVFPPTPLKSIPQTSWMFYRISLCFVFDRLLYYPVTFIPLFLRRK